nr:ABC transporter ATP-binding protein [Variovorax boronicumulans]
MSSDIAISVRGVSKVFDIYERPVDRLKQMLFPNRKSGQEKFWALSDINFDVKKGETVGIVGRNGSGKSTLLQTICGTLTPTTGTIERNGRLSALLELGSGFNPEFTGRENVFLNGAIIGMGRDEMAEKFDRIAAFADIGQFMDSPVKHYSSGMFARLAFSVAIHVDPEILIVDEILAVGDFAFQRKCLNKFYEIKETGCSILFVSHDQYQVKSVCQRAIYLDQGHQRIFGPAGQVIDQYMIDVEGRSAKKAEPLPSPQVEEATHKEGGAEAPGSNVAPSEYASEPERLYRITRVELHNSRSGLVVDTVKTGDSVRLVFEYSALVDNPPKKISFVFNLYRHDDLYLCGTTTLMDGVDLPGGEHGGIISVEFPEISLLSGRYKWRVAVNDHGGFVTHAEAKNACEFLVQDDFKAVGLFNLPRKWSLVPKNNEV